MNHGKKLRRFRGSPGRKLALRRGLVTQLLHHESIVTTLAKAKAIVRTTDKMITLAKRNTNAARSSAQSFLYPAHFINPEALAKSLNPDVRGIRPLGYPTERDAEKRLPRISTLPLMSKTMAEHSPIHRDPPEASSSASSKAPARDQDASTEDAAFIAEEEANEEDYAPPTSVLPKLFLALNKRYANRPGGYTRVMRLGRRRHDNAPTAVICMVDGPRDFRFEMAARQVGLELTEALGKRIATEPLGQGMVQYLSEEARAEVDKVLSVHDEARVAAFWERAQSHADEYYIRPSLNHKRALWAEEKLHSSNRGLTGRKPLRDILRTVEKDGDEKLSDEDKKRVAEYNLPRESILALRPGLRPDINPEFSVFDVMRKSFGKRYEADSVKKAEIARLKAEADAGRPKVAIKRRYLETQAAKKSLIQRAKEMFTEKLQTIERETRESGAGFGPRGVGKGRDLRTGEVRENPLHQRIRKPRQYSFVE